MCTAHFSGHLWGCLPRGVYLGAAGADLGFPAGGVPTYDFAKFSQKLHENENILGRSGRAPGAPPLDPPLGGGSVQKEWHTPVKTLLFRNYFYGR